MAERWWNELELETSEPSFTFDPNALTRISISPLVDIEKLTKEKTEFERQVIREAIRALNHFLIDLDMSSMELSENRFYFLDKAEYKQIWSKDARGKFFNGYAYIIRHPDPVNNIAVFTHELAHLASYYSLRIKHFCKNDKDFFEIIDTKRVGLDFYPRDKSKKAYFLGLNEAITEMFASEIRRYMVRETTLLNKEQIKELINNIHAYIYPVKLIENLIFSLEPKEKERLYLRQELLKNVISGEYTFIRKLEKRIRGAVKLFRTMGYELSDVFEVAEKLSVNL